MGAGESRLARECPIKIFVASDPKPGDGIALQQPDRPEVAVRDPDGFLRIIDREGLARSAVQSAVRAVRQGRQLIRTNPDQGELPLE